MFISPYKITVIYGNMYTDCIKPLESEVPVVRQSRCTDLRSVTMKQAVIMWQTDVETMIQINRDGQVFAQVNYFYTGFCTSIYATLVFVCYQFETLL